MYYIQDSKNTIINRIILGSAQLGSSYGISNERGQINKSEIDKIFNYASKEGINLIDTASGYGESERNIGELNNNKFQIITKISPLPDDIDIKKIKEWVNNELQKSLVNLKKDNIHALLIHKSADLFGKSGDYLYESIREAKEKGKIKNIGYSIYNTNELDTLYDKYEIDVVQLPMNILDRRFEISGWVKRLRNDHKQIHARSVFLQGLLLMNREDRPKYFSKWNSLWNEWDEYILNKKTTPFKACLGYMLEQLNKNNISNLIVGISCLNNLKEILDFAKSNYTPLEKDFNLEDEEILNPSLWRL